jgi:hypothetical protein
MTRDCRSGRYGHTGASSTPAASGAVAAGGTFFVGPSLHALCVRCILLLVGMYTVLEE